MMAKTHVVLCFLLVALATAATAADKISMQRVYSSVRSEFGAIYGSYFLPDRLVSEQIIMGLGIPDPTVELPGGNYLVSGCRPHSCDEKAAAIVTPAGVVLMAGLINFHCRRGLTGSKFFKDNPDANKLQILDQLEKMKSKFGI